MTQVANQIEAANISYDSSHNSNSVVATLLHAIGMHVEDFIPSNTEWDDLPGAETILDFARDLTGTNSADFIQGWQQNDTLIGGSGNDTLKGHEGNDSLDGGADHDRLEGWSGNDSLYGGNGDDTLTGGKGADLYSGGAGNDIFHIGSDGEFYGTSFGGDTIQGGTGMDIFNFTDSLDSIESQFSGSYLTGGVLARVSDADNHFEAHFDVNYEGADYSGGFGYFYTGELLSHNGHDYALMHDLLFYSVGDDIYVSIDYWYGRDDNFPIVYKTGYEYEATPAIFVFEDVGAGISYGSNLLAYLENHDLIQVTLPTSTTGFSFAINVDGFA